MDFTFLAEADAVSLQLERAKRNLEIAKFDFETAKSEYEALLGRADDNGIPKAKFKKLTEERLAGLIDSGLIDLRKEVAAGKEAKKSAPRPRASKQGGDSKDAGSEIPTSIQEVSPSTSEISVTENL